MTTHGGIRKAGQKEKDINRGDKPKASRRDGPEPALEAKTKQGRKGSKLKVHATVSRTGLIGSNMLEVKLARGRATQSLWAKD